MKRTSPVTALISTTTILMLATGCGGGDDGDDFESKLLSFEAQLESQSVILCECYMEFGIPSREMCEAMLFTEPPATARTCAADALDINPDASRAWLDCVIAVHTDYTACLDSNLVCGDQATLDGCNNAFNAAIPACGQLPPEVQTPFGQC